MIKKLNLLVLRTFIGPFFITFILCMFVLVVHFLWLYIDDLVGKGLEWHIIAELLLYTMASLIPLALPLAILLSSLMTFGNLGEHYELVAIKSAGISFRKTLSPLLALMVFFSIGAFFIANYLIPEANLKSLTLLHDVQQQKPALNIREGVFYNGIEGYSIKIGKKDPDNTTIYQVLIYDYSSPKGTTSVILAEKGTMVTSKDKNYLFFTLYNGRRYEELEPLQGMNKSYPHTLMEFGKEEVVFNLADFKLSRTNKELFKDNYHMLSVAELEEMADSIGIVLERKRNEAFRQAWSLFELADTGKQVKRSLFHRSALVHADSIVQKMPQSMQSSIIRVAANNVRNLRGMTNFAENDIESTRKYLARYNIEYHKKFTLSIACILFFFIGAPLGSIIRKGGLGMPVVVSIVIFVIYHVLSLFGERSAQEGAMEAWAGIWLAPALMLPFGIFLTYKASNDAALFRAEVYAGWWRSFVRLFRKSRKRENPSNL